TGNVACRTTLDPNAVNPHTGRVYSEFGRQGCVPFSVLGNGNISEEAQNWMNVNSFNFSRIQQTVFSASVANGSLFSLPAGDVGVAGGLEYREEKSREMTDPLAAQGLTFINAIPNRMGEYNVKEAFVETSIPLLAD